MKSKRRIFYGWVVAAAGLLIMMCTVGAVSNCISLYMVPICDEMGYSRSEVSVIQTVLLLGGLPVSALSAAAYRRFKVKHTLRVCGIVLCACVFLLSRARSLPAFYGITLILSLALWSMPYIPFSVLLNRWFHRRCGFVIGLVYMGTGIGGMLFNPITGSLIASVGWRDAMMTVSAVMTVVIIPCTFLVEERPEDKGLVPYGFDPRDADVADADAKGMSFREAVSERSFFILVAGISIFGMGTTVIIQTLGSYFSDLGYSIKLTAAVASATMASLAIGKVTLGAVYDRLGVARATAVSGMFLVGCFICALLLPGTLPLVLFIASYSLGNSFCTVAPPILIRVAFGMKDFNRIHGLIMTLSSIASACAPVLFGFIHDGSGSYAPGYIAFAAGAAVIGAAMVLSLTRQSEMRSGK